MMPGATRPRPPLRPAGAGAPRRRAAKPAAPFGIVTLASLDLRPRPDHRAELASQLVLGEVVRVLSAGPGAAWLEVENERDDYRGWVRSWGVTPASGRAASRWRAAATAQVRDLFVEARTDPAARHLATPLIWTSRVVPETRRGSWRRVALPDGRRVWVPAASLDARGAPPGLVERVTGLLGIPYLWGGRTPLGLDCSGFTQLVHFEQGLRLPRDSAQQMGACRPLREGEEPIPGDLVFFGPPRGPAGHVGIALGGGYYAHSRGAVRISSMDSDNTLYDSELGVTSMGWFRPLRAIRGTQF